MLMGYIIKEYSNAINKKSNINNLSNVKKYMNRKYI